MTFKTDCIKVPNQCKLFKRQKMMRQYLSLEVAVADSSKVQNILVLSLLKICGFIQGVHKWMPFKQCK